MATRQQSQRNRFSREGFQPIPTDHNNRPNMGQSHDVTVDIPLERVQTTTSGGRRAPDANATGLQPSMTHDSPSNEKKSFFKGRRLRPTAGVTGTGRVGYDGEEDTMTTMGKIYDKIFGFSIVTRYFLYVLPMGLLIAVPIIVGSVYSDKNTPKIGGVPIVWLFTWVEIIWLSLWVSKLVAHFLPYIFQLFVGVVSSGVRKYATVIRKLEIPLSLVGWAVTSVATFKPLMTENPYNSQKVDNVLVHNTTDANWVNIVQKILGAAVASSLVFLAEKFIIQLISINYHRKQFNFRIKDSKRQIYILGLLYDASKAIFPQYCPEFAEEDYIIADQLNLSALGGTKKKRPHHHRSGSTTPGRVLQTVGRVGDKMTSAFGDVAKEITGREVFNPNSSHSVVIEALEKKRTAEALARRIWMSLVIDGNEELREEDIMDVFGDERRAEAEEAYWSLDRDGNGDISLDEMIQTVTEWGRERKAIATSMVDVAQAINVLDKMLCTVVLVAIVFIFIAFLNTNFVTTLATAGTALLSLSFVFSVTAQEFLGSCIFLFVKHPFDVSDRVDIAGEPYIVEHISLLFTVFRRASGLKTGQLCQYPNIVLNSLALDNVSRSGVMTEQITLDVSFATSFDDVQILKNELKNFVTDSANSRDFQPDLEVEVLGTSDLSKLQLKIDVRHKSNWSNETLRAARRSKFMCALVAALRAVPINPPGGGVDAAGSAANPNYSVAISDSIAKENAEHSAEEREKARLISTKKINDAKESLSPLSPSATRQGMGGLNRGDAAIINDLNSREPGADQARDEAWATGRGDSSTLGDRESMDQQDLADVRGLLRRESTRGKRKPSNEQPRLYQPQAGIPTINEPGFSTSYVPPTRGYQAADYENQRQTQYSSAQSTVPNTSTTSPSIQLNQFPQPSPYRTQTQQNQQLAPTRESNEHHDRFGNARPYSGV